MLGGGFGQVDVQDTSAAVWPAHESSSRRTPDPVRAVKPVVGRAPLDCSRGVQGFVLSENRSAPGVMQASWPAVGPPLGRAARE